MNKAMPILDHAPRIEAIGERTRQVTEKNRNGSQCDSISEPPSAGE